MNIFLHLLPFLLFVIISAIAFWYGKRRDKISHKQQDDVAEKCRLEKQRKIDWESLELEEKKLEKELRRKQILSENKTNLYTAITKYIKTRRDASSFIGKDVIVTSSNFDNNDCIAATTKAKMLGVRVNVYNISPEKIEDCCEDVKRVDYDVVYRLVNSIGNIQDVNVDIVHNIALLK